LAALAARQHGVVSIRQLCGPLGFSRTGVEEAMRGGRLHRIHRGVYAVGHRVLSLHGECLAAVLAVGPGSLLSYWSAGWLWGLIWTQPTTVHVTATGPRRLRDRAPVRVHRARNLVAADRRLEEVIPVTSVARTYLDLAEVAKPRRLPGLLKRGEELKLLDHREVLACCERSRGHRGAKPLAAALVRYRPEARTIRSGLERRFLPLIEAAGLPLPATNYVVGAHEVDAYWSEARLAVELDTFGTHGTHVSFESDRERDAELAEAGIATIRITEGRLEADPAGVVRQLATLLAARRDAAPRRRASPPSPV
jgi:putative AbiEi antitoxin of type IV toxin-antitoxin system